ncbi:unnamed protein product, partial [Prorocentrum cordatum]
ASDFTLASQAVFAKLKKKLNIGVKHQRLQTVAVSIHRLRQEKAPSHVWHNSERALKGEGSARRVVHLSIGHMWDEVEVKQAWRPSKKYRVMRKNVAMPALVQRSTVNLSLANVNRERGQQYQRYWLAQPVEVCGTKAKDLLPGTKKGIPTQADCQDFDILTNLLGSVSSFAFQPMCDRASANISILKVWANQSDLLTDQFPDIAQKVLYFPDTCGIHAHHRGKLKVKGLRKHTMRHYSIASMSRYRGNLSRCIAGIETPVEDKLHREVGPAGPFPDTLEAVADTLYDCNAEHHTRPRKDGKGRGESQLLKDLKELIVVANGSLSADTWTHHCWDSAQ